MLLVLLCGSDGYSRPLGKEFLEFVPVTDGHRTCHTTLPNELTVSISSQDVKEKIERMHCQFLAENGGQEVNRRN